MKICSEIKHGNFVKYNYCPKLFTTKIAEFVDNAFEVIKTYESEYKRNLLTLMLTRFIISTRPFGHFSTLKYSQLIDQGKIEEALSDRMYVNNNLRQIYHPYHQLKKIAKDINYGVMANGQENKVTQGDVFDFIKNIKADILYMDPPYADTASYEESYNVLDNILDQKVEKPIVSNFTKKDTLDFIDKMLSESTHIPYWVISMGQTNPEKGIKPEELLEVVKKYKTEAKVDI